MSEPVAWSVDPILDGIIGVFRRPKLYFASVIFVLNLKLKITSFFLKAQHLCGQLFK